MANSALPLPSEASAVSEAPAAEPRKPAVRPRHAASLILLRETAAGPEVLMGLRGAKARFMPNRLVFPGGRVDAGDTRLPAAREPGDITRAHLEKNANPALARALPRTAIRELTEETGLEFGTPPDLSPLDYLCRAVTPSDQPIRFNARFLVAPADAARGTLGGSGELEGLRWFRVEDALALDLARITRNVLEELTIWRGLPAEVRAAPRRTPWYRTYGGTRARSWE